MVVLVNGTESAVFRNVLNKIHALCNFIIGRNLRHSVSKKSEHVIGLNISTALNVWHAIEEKLSIFEGLYHAILRRKMVWEDKWRVSY